MSRNARAYFLRSSERQDKRSGCVAVIAQRRLYVSFFRFFPRGPWPIGIKQLTECSTVIADTETRTKKKTPIRPIGRIARGDIAISERPRTGGKCGRTRIFGRFGGLYVTETEGRSSDVISAGKRQKQKVKARTIHRRLALGYRQLGRRHKLIRSPRKPPKSKNHASTSSS